VVAVVFALVSGLPAAARTQTAQMPPPSTITTIDPATATLDAPAPPRPPGSALPPAWGANALVSANAASLTRPQVEPSVDSKPSDRSMMVAGYADSISDSAPGVSRSVDGGATWTAPTGGAILPNPPGFTWGNRNAVGGLAGGDPAIAWSGPLGVQPDTVYASYIGFQNNSNPPTPNKCDNGGLYVYRSTDGGNTWTLPAAGPAIPNTQTVFRDKEYIAVDHSPLSPYLGTIYMTWDDDVYAGCPQIFGTNFVTRRIMLSKSTDGGATWSSPLTLATGCLVTSIPAVGADGSVYVVWFDCSSGVRQLVRKSTDGGATFTPAVAAASGLTSCPNPHPGASFRVNAAFPTIATDPTDASRVYVAWSSCTAQSQADVFFSRSLNGGATWSATPLRVNDDATTNPRDQFFPWMVVDDLAVIRLMWGDDRLDTVNAGGHFYDIFAAESTDDGASFSPNVRVTNVSSDPNIDFGGTFIGDYFGMAVCGTPVWGDTRNGNQDIFGAPLDADQNGVVDSCQKTTAAVLASLRASRAGSAVAIRWRTVSELETLGFNVWRSATHSGPYRRINARLIQARTPGTNAGTSYSYTDRSAQRRRTYFYKLELKDISASSFTAVARVTR
jgi:hypothetical protein